MFRHAPIGPTFGPAISSACSKRNEMNPPPMVAASASRATMEQFLDVSGDQQRMFQGWKSIPCNSLDICSEECHRMSQMTLNPKLQLSRASTGCLRQWSSSIRRHQLCFSAASSQPSARRTKALACYCSRITAGILIHSPLSNGTALPLKMPPCMMR